ncbi:MAG: DUF4125 family protein [Lachnospiraceae bacterium]|nr:DUF4125 family protein [Lachnospiraceae bacterium]
MNIDAIYAEIDRLYTAGDNEGCEKYILENIEEAARNKEENIMIQLLNELIGHYRETGDFENLKLFSGKLLDILDNSSVKGSMAHATSLLNIANAYRAAGLLKESNRLYQEVKSYYDANVSPDSMLYASLLNNMALLFQEMNDHESAADCLERALGIARSHSDSRIEEASTCANLAATLIKLDRLDEAEEHLTRAFELFEKDEVPDYHYSAALSAMGEIKFIKKEYGKSVEYYEKALNEIERCVGKSHAYEITKQNMEAAKQMLEQLPAGDSEKESINDIPVSGLELSRMYYEKFGKQMIHEKFPKYEDRIAVGLVGEGSECFGFDDELSTDHDFGPGFCMWLAKEDFKKIGKELQKEYEKLPKEFMGYSRLETAKAGQRTGVFSIDRFYKKFTGIKRAPKKEEEWFLSDDAGYAHVVNGDVFEDPLGGFTWIRNKIKEYYPDSVWKCRIAQAAALMSQSGQYNYPRMLKRGDSVTASVYLADFMRSTMQMMYLLNRQFAPYQKWMYKGLEKLENAGTVRSLLEKLPDASADDRLLIIEDICTEILGTLHNMGFTGDTDNYLDHHTSEIIYGVSKAGKTPGAVTKPTKDELIDRIVSLEWKAFDKVENQGGRASCQDDYATFSVMRKSQYMLWDEEMLESFIADFETANARGWNLITEKYGRMEETSAPEEYEKIKDSLPMIPEDKKQIIEAIVAIQVQMMEDFAKEYPKAASEARSIHTSEDTLYNTSYETYLRGEISTYSDLTLSLYGRFVARMAGEGKNIAKETIANSALCYGYASLDDMESKL